MSLDGEILQAMLGLTTHLGGEMGHVLRQIVPAACRPAGDRQVASRCHLVSPLLLEVDGMGHRRGRHQPGRGAGEVGERLAIHRQTTIQRSLQRVDQQIHPVGRPRHRAGRGGYDLWLEDPVLAQCPAQVVDDDPYVLRVEPVDLVQDEEELLLVAGHLRDVLVMEHCVAVLLGIGDPCHHVDPGKEGIDPVAMIQFHAVVVREIEQAQPRWTVVLDTVGDPEFVQKPIECLRSLGRDHCQRFGCHRADATGQGHLFAGDRIDEARLA